MTVLRVVPKEHMEIIKSYLEPGVVLIEEGVAAQLEGQFDIDLSDGRDVDYDFGGEADCYVDIVRDERHYLISEMIGEAAND
jgi:hypothetical protein